MTVYLIFTKNPIPQVKKNFKGCVLKEYKSAEGKETYLTMLKIPYANTFIKCLSYSFLNLNLRSHYLTVVFDPTEARIAMLYFKLDNGDYVAKVDDSDIQYINHFHAIYPIKIQEPYHYYTQKYYIKNNAETISNISGPAAIPTNIIEVITDERAGYNAEIRRIYAKVLWSNRKMEKEVKKINRQLVDNFRSKFFVYP